MIRLMFEGERIDIPTPWEDEDGSLEAGPSLPLLTVCSSVLEVSEISRIQGQLQNEMITALTHSDDYTRSPLSGAYRAHVDVRHLPLPKEERKRLEDHLGGRVAELLAEHRGEDPEALASAVARTCVATSPGDAVSLTPVRDLLAAPPAGLDPNLPMNILVAPPSGDVLVLEVFPWPAPVLPVDEVRVGLATAVDWAKQIVAWTVCSPQHHQFVRRDGKGVADWMTVSRADNLNAVVFRKPKIFGIWFDIFYFDVPEFIDVLGGRFARFTWYRD